MSFITNIFNDINLVAILLQYYKYNFKLIKGIDFNKLNFNILSRNPNAVNILLPLIDINDKKIDYRFLGLNNNPEIVIKILVLDF